MQGIFKVLLSLELERYLLGPIGEKMVSLANQLKEEGKREGFQIGIQIGIKKGMIIGYSIALNHLIERKFGPVPHSLLQLIQEADSDQLLKWIRRILEVEHIFQLFEEENSELLHNSQTSPERYADIFLTLTRR